MSENLIDPSIFKAYDIRGIYNENIDEAAAGLIAKAYAQIVKPQKVVVGRDGRTSSPSLAKTIMDTLVSLGIDVVDVGQVSTDMYYWACANKNLPGIMVTASHNPKQYNGFKMVRKIPYLLSGDEGIQDMLKAIQSNDLPLQSNQPGTIDEYAVMNGYIDKIMSLVNVSELKPFKIIADTANGMVGPSLTELFKRLNNIELTPMYFEIDGTFPNHGGDPLLAENRAELQQRVVDEGFDLGFAFDPDGDRFFCIDNKGRFVPGDFMTAILSEYFLRAEPGSTIVYDIRASVAVKDTIEKAGGKALFNRVGHAFIKKRMSDEDAIFGGEVTGHYYFRDFFGCDSGLAPMMYLLQILSGSELTLDQIVDNYESKYFISGEINSQVADVRAVIKNLKDHYGPSSQNIIEIDGVTIDSGSWRFNVRGSNTEPLIRLNLEASNQKLMEEKRDEVLALIRV